MTPHRDEREVRGFVYRQRRGEETSRPSHGRLLDVLPERLEIDCAKEGCGERRMRFVLRLLDGMLVN